MGTKRHGLKAARNVAIVFGAFLLIGFLVLERMGLIADYLAAPAVYAEAKSLGMPATLREIGQRESNQAGEEFLALGEIVSGAAQASGSLSMMPRTEEWYEPDWQAIERQLSRAVAPLDADLDAIVALSEQEIIIGHDYTSSSDRSPELSYYKDLAKLLGMRAQLAAIQGQREDAIRDLNALRSLGRSCARAETAIAYLAASAMQAIGEGSSLRCALADPNYATRYVDAIQFDEETRFQELATFYRFMMFGLVRDARGMRLGITGPVRGTDPDRGLADSLPTDIYARLEMARALRWVNPHLRLVSSDGINARKLGSMMQDMPSYKGTFRDPDDIHGISRRLVRALIESRALATLAERIETGKPPKPLPEDSYGDRLRFHEDEKVLIVYSVGEDGHDDKATGIVRFPWGPDKEISDDVGVFVFRAALRRSSE